MQIVKVEMPNRSYEVYNASGQVNSAFFPQLLTTLKAGTDHVIIVDERVHALYGDLYTGLNTIVVPSGEDSKCFAMLERVLDQMTGYQLTREGIVIALGGGVVGDLAGFAASVYKRGVKWIGVPTTLLSMVDSSVGGKVAVNLKAGKNLAGAFHQPVAVYIDPVMLGTLAPRELSNGLAEMIKLGIALDNQYFEALERFPIEHLFSSIPLTALEAEAWETLITRACAIKAHIVETDERDRGLRMHLNFGHTIGHAIERYYEYRDILHGEAVALGMWLKCKIACSEGIIKESELLRIKRLLERCGLKTTLINLNATAFEVILSHFDQDKKQDSQLHEGYLNWIGLMGFGSSTVERIPMQEAKRKLIKAFKE